MKKVFVILLLISLISFNTYGETYNGKTSIELSYTEEPTYSVKIPESLDITNNETYFDYYLSGDIYADQNLQILFDSQTNITNGIDSYVVNITQDKNTYTHEDLSNECTSRVTIIHDELHSGNYTGELNVSISLLEVLNEYSIS